MIGSFASFGRFTAILFLFVVNVSANNDPFLYGSNISQLSKLNASEYFPEEDDRSTYLGWLEEHPSSYMKHTFLPMTTEPHNGAAVFWKLFAADTDATSVGRSGNNAEYTHIQVAVAVRATGWVGFGISEAGGMLGSDIALFETANPTTIRDSYVIEDFDVPKEDDCQHWALIDTIMENGWLIVEMSRPLDTMDTQDHVVVDDSQLITPTRLIAAWGDSPTASYHGFQVAKTSTTIFPLPVNGDDFDGTNIVYTKSFEEQMEEQADGYFEIKADNYTLPAQETTYHYVCKSFDELKAEFNLPETEDGILTLIAGGAVLALETEPYVHHFIVYGSSNPNPTQEECGQGFSMLWGWAPGEGPQALPENVGIPLFDANGNFRSISVEIHYNNPENLEGLVDNSGFRIYYTVKPREVEAAWFSAGDPGTLMNGQQIADGLTEYSYTCASDCTTSVLGGESVTVIAETLHMHKTGVRMTNEVIRNGEVVNLGAVDVFEFDQQGSFKVQQDMYEILPGDSFKTTCYYRDGIAFGYSSQEEMCIAFLLYYPAKKLDFGTFGSFPWACFYGIDLLPVCSEELENRTLESEEGLGRRFGTPPTQCMALQVDGQQEDEEKADFGFRVAPKSSSLIALAYAFLLFF